MPRSVIILRVGTPTLGEWCPRCVLPSAGLYPVYAGAVEVGQFLACLDCGWKQTPVKAWVADLQYRIDTFADDVERALWAGTL